MKHPHPPSAHAAERALRFDPQPFTGGDLPPRPEAPPAPLSPTEARRARERERARKRALAVLKGKKSW